MIPDNYTLFELHEERLRKEEEKLPECSDCGAEQSDSGNQRLFSDHHQRPDGSGLYEVQGGNGYGHGADQGYFFKPSVGFYSDARSAGAVQSSHRQNKAQKAAAGCVLPG